MDLIDLHTHSTCSDGLLSPVELVDLARTAGLRALALTDHDTVDGIGEALEHGRSIGLEVVAGLEVSAWHDHIPMHILGYCFDPGHAGLRERLERVQQGRHERNVRIVEKLRQLGIDVSMELLGEISGRGQTGRPHIARMLVELGAVPTVELAFTRYLRRGAAAYMERFRYRADEAIAMIGEAGGVAVLAHPSAIDPAPASLEEVLAGLKRAGLTGIEALYPGHSAKTVRQLRRLAEKLDLLITGGSDFHGDRRSGAVLAGGSSGILVPYRLLEEMKARAGAGG